MMVWLQNHWLRNKTDEQHIDNWRIDLFEKKENLKIAQIEKIQRAEQDRVNEIRKQEWIKKVLRNEYTFDHNGNAIIIKQIEFDQDDLKSGHKEAQKKNK